MAKRLGRRRFIQSSAAAVAGVSLGMEAGVPVVMAAGRRQRDSAGASHSPGSGQGAGELAVTAFSARMPYTSEKEGHLLVTVPPLPGSNPLTCYLFFNNQSLVSSGHVTAGSRTAVPFPLDALPQGTSRLTCRLAANGQTLVTLSAEVIKLPPRSNEVKIDYTGRGLLVDGLPYLPFGFYAWFPPNGLPDEEATQGFTHIAVYQSKASGQTPSEMTQIRAYMDRCAAVGMKVHYDVRKVATLPPSARKTALLRSEIEAFKDHPALLCWYAADEPNGNGIPAANLEESYRLLKQLDPYHPVTIVLNDPAAAPTYAGAMDIIMADPYPIPRSPVTKISDWSDRLNRAVGYHQPLWIVPQAFGGGEWWQREPSSREERVMTYLALIHGATGIQYFVRRPPIGNPKSPILWSECRRLALEAAELAPALLSGEARPGITCTPDTVHGGAWQDRGEITLLLTNTQNNPGSFRVQLEGSSYTGKASVLFEDRQIDVQNGLLSEPIDAYGTRAYVIPVGPAPLDDLKIDPANLVINPSFEEMADAGTPNGCYASVNDDPASSLFVDSRVARHGRHSLRVTTPTQDQGVIIEPFPIPLKAGTSYRVSIWAMGKMAGLPFELSLGPVATRQFNLTTTWQEYSFTGISPSSVAKAHLSIRLIGAGTAWFDLLQVTPGV